MNFYFSLRCHISLPKVWNIIGLDHMVRVWYVVIIDLNVTAVGQKQIRCLIVLFNL